MKLFYNDNVDDMVSEVIKILYFRYELSQYLLDKQIELLERKYGGDKARNAALVIQRYVLGYYFFFNYMVNTYFYYFSELSVDIHLLKNLHTSRLWRNKIKSMRIKRSMQFNVDTF